VLLHRETIGTSCLAGSLVYVSCHYFAENEILSVALASICVILVRELSIKYDWHLPKVGGK
jgi:uncharacterized membrane protein YeiH